MTPKEIGQMWTEKTGLSFFNEFVEYFPTEQSFQEWLNKKGLSMEEHNGHMDWYPEGESFEIGKLFGIDLENNEENLDNYIDFFNEMCENKW